MALTYVEAPQDVFILRRTTLEILRRFNAAVFEGQLPADLDIAWNARLKTTAGTTHFRRDPPTTLTGPPRWGTALLRLLHRSPVTDSPKTWLM